MKRKINRDLDENAYANWLWVVVVIGILVIGFFVVMGGSSDGSSDSGGWDSDDSNPVTERKYLSVDTTASFETTLGTITGYQIDNIDKRVETKRLSFSWMGEFALWEPEQKLSFKLLDSSNTIVDEAEKEIDLTGDGTTISVELGPFPDDVTEYTLEVKLYVDGDQKDSVSEEGFV